MRSDLSIKIAESLDLEQHIQEFFSKNGDIEKVPANVYKKDSGKLKRRIDTIKALNKVK